MKHHVDTQIDVSKDLAFNPEARYDKDHSNQSFVDSLVADNLTKQSQKDIDELFSKK